jgi:hypothetical protein
MYAVMAKIETNLTRKHGRAADGQNKKGMRDETSES